MHLLHSHEDGIFALQIANEHHSHCSHPYDYEHTSLLPVRQIQPSFKSGVECNVFGGHGEKSGWGAV